jgi:hypothetical protein
MQFGLIQYSARGIIVSEVLLLERNSPISTSVTSLRQWMTCDDVIFC